MHCHVGWGGVDPPHRTCSFFPLPSRATAAKFGGVLRELIQNADDAAAISLDVALRRDCGAVVGMIVSNDGRPFSDADWARLTRIAEGNPAESTVGMFGVGARWCFSPQSVF